MYLNCSAIQQWTIAWDHEYSLDIRKWMDVKVGDCRKTLTDADYLIASEFTAGIVNR